VRSTYPKLASITPANPRVLPSATQVFTVALDKPAEASITVDVSLEPASGLGRLDVATVAIAKDASSGTVTFTATDSTEGASGTFVAKYDGVTLTTPVTVVGYRKGLVINEVDYDQSVNPDAKEFVELYNSSSAPISLTDLVLVFVNGSNNTEYLRAALAPVGELGPGEYLVIGSAAFLETVTAPGVKKLALLSQSGLATDIIQNGQPDGVAIYDKATDALVDSLAYEGDMKSCTIEGATAKFNLMEGTKVTTNLIDPGNKEGSLVRIPNAQDSDSNMDDFKFTSKSTPGAANELVP